MTLKHVPNSFQPGGYHTVNPYLVVRNVDGLLDFLQQVFDAQLGDSFRGPDGKIMHTEARIGDSAIMMSEATAENPPVQAIFHVYVEDVDAVYQRALMAGASSIREPTDEFYGERSGIVQDPFGIRWDLATFIEDVSIEEMQRRMEALIGQGAGAPDE